MMPRDASLSDRAILVIVVVFFSLETRQKYERYYIAYYARRRAGDIASYMIRAVLLRIS